MHSASCTLALGVAPSVLYDDSGDGVSSVATYPAFMTVEEFEVFPFPEGKGELVRGEPRVNLPAEAPHGVAQSNLMWLLGSYVYPRKLGRVFSDGLGYELRALPRTVRNPDLSFIRSERMPVPVERGFMKVVPDLAVEVLSPSEKAWELEEKIEDYQTAGTPLLWVVDPKRRTVKVITLHTPSRLLKTGDVLDGGDVVPGFTCSVSELFEGLAP